MPDVTFPEGALPPEVTQSSQRENATGATKTSYDRLRENPADTEARKELVGRKDQLCKEIETIKKEFTPEEEAAYEEAAKKYSDYYRISEGYKYYHMDEIPGFKEMRQAIDVSDDLNTKVAPNGDRLYASMWSRRVDGSNLRMYPSNNPEPLFTSFLVRTDASGKKLESFTISKKYKLLPSQDNQGFPEAVKGFVQAERPGASSNRLDGYTFWGLEYKDSEEGESNILGRQEKNLTGSWGTGDTVNPVDIDVKPGKDPLGVLQRFISDAREAKTLYTIKQTASSPAPQAPSTQAA